MKYTLKIKRAMRFSIKTHEVYQKQKRKGKDIAYITHPMTVALILALAGANEDLIVAGILHDTIEDSTPEKKVTRDMIHDRFGGDVANLVESVTETGEGWDNRKAEVIRKIKEEFSHDSLLLKSADVIANKSESVDDYGRYGEELFERFHAPKEKVLKYYLDAIDAILARWEENPLKDDLVCLRDELKLIRD